MVLALLSVPAATIGAAGVAAVPGVVAAWLSYRASSKAGAASWAAGQTLGVIGPRNGETVSETLYRLAQLEQYQHTRNHDILNALTAMMLLLEVIAQAEGIDLRDVQRAEHPPPPTYPPTGDDDRG